MNPITFATFTLLIVAAAFNEAAAVAKFSAFDGMEVEKDSASGHSDDRVRLTRRMLRRLRRERRPAARRATREAFEAKPTTTAAPVFCADKSDNALSEHELKIPVCKKEAQAKQLSDLEQDFNHHRSWKKDVMNAFAAQGAEAGHYLTVGTFRQSNDLHNWLWQLGTDVHVVHAGLDQESHRVCEMERHMMMMMAQGANASSAVTLECVPLSGWLPDELFDIDTITPGSCVFNMVEWAKPRILKAAVEATEHPVILMNADVKIVKDLRPLASVLLSLKPGRVMVTTQEDDKAISTDAVFATKASTKLLSQWGDKVFDCMGSSDAGKSALQHMAFYERQSSLLATFPLSEVGRCEEPRKRRSATFACKEVEPGASHSMLELDWRRREGEGAFQDEADSLTATADMA